MPERHRGARGAVLGIDHRALGPLGSAGADRRPRQFAARAGEVPGPYLRRENREGEHSDRNAAGLRARRPAEAAEALLPRRSRRGRAPRRLGRGARESEGLKGIALLLLGLAAGAAWSASQEENLKALRGRIDAINRALEKNQAATREARDALRDSERAISNANRALARLGAEARQVRAEAARNTQRRHSLQMQVAKREAAIERMLVAWSAPGAPDALRVMLSGDDPADLGRRLHYLGVISRAAAALIAEQRAALAELERLGDEAQARAARLRAIEQASRADRDKVLAERRERQRVLKTLGADIRKNRREIQVLRADEARLAQLVEALARAAASAASGPFSALRGKLRLPVRGELTGRFGAPRGAAGTEAKGVFIRAPEGQPVRAIAGGRVVYADWMRGFGNLLIVDHGESYLSIYANNESVLKELGDAVVPGETIATTGSSGGNEQTGLYFEMRHLGRAFDPLSWVKLK